MKSHFFVNQFQTLLCVAVVWGNLWTTWPRNTVLSRTITCMTLWTASDSVIISRWQTELENCVIICYNIICAIIQHSKRVNWKNLILVIIFFRINMYNYINKENFKSYFLNVFQIHMCQLSFALLQSMLSNWNEQNIHLIEETEQTFLCVIKFE